MRWKMMDLIKILGENRYYYYNFYYFGVIRVVKVIQVINQIRDREVVKKVIKITNSNNFDFSKFERGVI